MSIALPSGASGGGTATAAPDAGVHLHLRGELDEDAVTALREQLAACLGAGIRHITVHVDRQPDLELAPLQVLQGAARYLSTRDGSLRLVGASPAVLRRLAINEMTDLIGPREVPRATAGRRARTRR